jgi:8-oxo-dGTP pyrophosphatase MutT (NUDIX family)
MVTSPAQQVAALPWRRRKGNIEILLVTSRETKRWVIPKGWQMPNLIDSNAAKREAYEEAGIDGRVRRNPIGRYTYVKRTAGARRRCHVTVYALLVQVEHRKWPERKERKRLWYSVANAARKVREPKLRAILRSFAAT